MSNLDFDQWMPHQCDIDDWKFNLTCEGIRMRNKYYYYRSIQVKFFDENKAPVCENVCVCDCLMRIEVERDILVNFQNE